MTNIKDIEDIQKISGEVIDISSATAALKKSDDTFVKKMLKMLITSLPNELKLLSEAYHKKDWETIKMVAHKLRGCTGYCGTPRLRIACVNMENYLTNNKIVLRDDLYTKLVTELNNILSTYKRYNF